MRGAQHVASAGARHCIREEAARTFPQIPQVDGLWRAPLRAGAGAPALHDGGLGTRGGRRRRGASGGGAGLLLLAGGARLAQPEGVLVVLEERDAASQGCTNYSRDSHAARQGDGAHTTRRCTSRGPLGGGGLWAGASRPQHAS